MSRQAQGLDQHYERGRRVGSMGFLDPEHMSQGRPPCTPAAAEAYSARLLPTSGRWTRRLPADQDAYVRGLSAGLCGYARGRVGV